MILLDKIFYSIRFVEFDKIIDKEDIITKTKILFMSWVKDIDDK